MPLPFAWLIALALGVTFAHAARGELQRHDGLLLGTHSAVLVLAFAGLVLVPVTGYFAAFHGDWAYLYLVAWHRVPSAVDLAAVLVAGALVWVGFVVGARSAGSPGRSTLLVAGPLGLGVVLALLAFRRLPVAASYAQYHGGFGGQTIAASPLGKGVILALLTLVAATAWTLRLLRRTT